jgi:hypothetical protein
VQLGFRGARREKTAALKEWHGLTEDVLKGQRGRAWTDKPSERPVPSNVAPREGRNRLLRAMLLFFLLLGLLVGGVTFFTIDLLGRQ